MNPLIALSIACAAFLAGFVLTLLAVAIALQIAKPKPDDEDTGASEGAFPIGQSSPPSSPEG